MGKSVPLPASEDVKLQAAEKLTRGFSASVYWVFYQIFANYSLVNNETSANVKTDNLVINKSFVFYFAHWMNPVTVSV